MEDMVRVGKDAVQIQAVINTLESLSLPATFDNVNKLTGIYQVLTEIRDRLAAQEEKKDGEAEVR